MELKYNVSEEDYIQFNIFHYENSKAMKRQKLLMAVLFPLAFMVIGIIAKGEVRYFFFVMAGLFLVFWLIFGPTTMRKSIAKNVQKLMKEGKGNEFVGEHTLTFLDEKLRSANGGQVMETSYDNIRYICQDKERIYIYVGAVSAAIIPISAFKSEAEKHNFLEEVKKRGKNI